MRSGSCFLTLVRTNTSGREILSELCTEDIVIPETEEALKHGSNQVRIFLGKEHWAAPAKQIQVHWEVVGTLGCAIASLLGFSMRSEDSVISKDTWGCGKRGALN